MLEMCDSSHWSQWCLLPSQFTLSQSDANLTSGPAPAFSSQLHLIVRGPPPSCAAATHPRDNWCTALCRQAAHSLVAGGRQGTQLLGNREGRQQNLKVTNSFPLHFLQASSQKHSLLHWHFSLPAPTFSHPLPCQPLLSWLPQAKFVSMTGCLSIFCFHLFFPFLTREVSHTRPWEQPLPSYRLTETHPPLPGKCYLKFSSSAFSKTRNAKEHC